VYDKDEVVGMISLVDLRKGLPGDDEAATPTEDSADLTAADIMARNPVTLQTHQTAREAALLFSENEFHAIPVLEGEELVGIVSTTDIIRFLIEALDER
jgi:CBS domain-containing protein